MTDAIETTGALFANVEDRTVRGRLFTWGEQSRTSQTGHQVAFAKGTLKTPRDITALNANISHDHYKPAARFTSIEDDGIGLVAEFKIADSEEGDELLAGIASGRLARLSAEVSRLITRGKEAVSGVLSGAAFVEEGAFASAALFAIGDVTEADEEEPQAVEKTPLAQAIQEAVQAVVDEYTDSTNADAEPTVEVVTDAETDASETPSEETQTEETIMTDVVIPEGVQVQTPEDKKADTSAGALFAALAYAKQSGDQSVLAPFAGGNANFAIANIQQSGPSAVTIGADTGVPAFLGEMWTKKSYSRKYWNLVQNAPLTSFKVTGWKWDAGKEPVVAAYAGNTAEVPSNAVDTVPVSADARRIAGGHRIDRKFFDFNDQEVIASYFRQMTESYARVSDLDILAKIVAAATTTTPGTVPSGIAKGLAAVIDGALDVIQTENTPSFAIVSPELWRDIVLTGKNDVLGFLSAGFGLEEGSLSGFSIIPGAVGTGKVVVGAREAMTAFELPGSPIRVEGLAPHNGAIDPALYGYIADITNNAAAIRIVTTAS
ncbi:phage major capsid protein [Microbacterium sp. Ag1]|uniref:phage major capsid protein n=1 Tax=Microbacterium sp. Ag1 TaxID=1643443 RepID=UPI000629119B|nr:hypothetical protein [Microbacterium sp. Ag1]KKX96924.1 hypothetical protein AAY78_16675 [Microbacterium sp. Ag1]